MLTLDQFLASVEAKAYRMAVLAVKNDADALDIVQDSMIKLAKSYGHYSSDENSSSDETEQWRPLFFRILQNSIMDFHRKQSRWKRWFVRAAEDDEGNEDSEALDNQSQAFEHSPEQYLQQQQMGAQALEVMEALPVKQQQCFLLRCWEGFSVQETAEMMGISPGSVKTHYFRAVQKMTQVLYEET